VKAGSKYLIALSAALGLFPVVLDSTIVNVAIVPIERSLQTSVDMVQWIILGFLLSNAAMTPPAAIWAFASA
jgi:DHA2 family multidrug resistance protein